MTRPPSGRRSFLRDRTGLAWLVAAVVVSVAHRWIPAATWLMVHLVLLGALTHSAMVWTEHFSHTLLRTAADDAARRRQSWRLGLLASGAALVFAGVPLQVWPLTVVGATLVTAAVGWHGVRLARALRAALPSRFRKVVRYYVAAAACLPVGAALGATLALGLDDEWHGRLLIAHTMVNLLGWIGLTVTGTLVTFWPTMLRTRMDDRAERLARQALGVLLAGVALMPTGALLGWRWLALAGLAVYAGGLAWWGRALLRPALAKPPAEFAPASVGLALMWAVGALCGVGWLLATSPSWRAVTDGFGPIVSIVVVGFGVQLLTGALSYLLPSVLGGGPSVVRAGQAWFNKGTTVRLVVINAGLLLWLVPAPSWVRVTLSITVLAALAAFVPLMLKGIRASVAERRRIASEAAIDGVVRSFAPGDAAPPRPATRPADAPDERSVWSGNQLVAGIAALVVALTLGVGVDPAAAGLTSAATPGAGAAVVPTGRTTTVAVTAAGMRFLPSRIEVPAGDRLVIELTNADPTTTHDLIVGGARTPRLAPGATASLDVGVLGASAQGWCSVAGHKQMGMVLDIVVGGVEPTDTPAENASLTRTVDPALPPLTDEKVRRVTLRVQEVPLEVAPGVWQRRWTFNGSVPGPTLHGRVGDTFEITLVNEGSMGHSIDFHASELAPDVPMRTIPPGESLVYRFTAKRSGIWMYHCSTMPMSTHIAAGMHGAVVIEPDGLADVDRSYVFVQSEVYLGAGGATASDATEVNADKVAAQAPDRVVFNGIANQYDSAQVPARVGERVRVWVLAAGPNRPSTFHVVGGQFDTVYLEGAYQLRRGKDAFGRTGGGSQALGLGPAQGGFVELTFAEAGHYPFVTHLMSDAERGAHGIFDVRP